MNKVKKNKEETHGGNTWEALKRDVQGDEGRLSVERQVYSEQRGQGRQGWDWVSKKVGRELWVK